MKILPVEKEILLYKEGFDDTDVLQRARTGEALSNLVDTVTDPLVITIDGRWGVGKSYFLKRWVGAHKLQNDGISNTVYFDAFSQDYMGDPLTSLISAIEDRIPDAGKPQFQRVKNAAFSLVRPLTRIGLSVATFGATEALGDLGDAVAGAVGSEASSRVDRFWQREANRHTAMVEFGNALTDLIKCSSSNETAALVPLTVVVDELDRCRPDYALEVLEVIKHFFAIPGVHFVLGTNLRALEQSVVARYGAGLDAEAYLRKFIDLRLTLPSNLGDRYNDRPASIIYLEYQIKQMQVPDHLATKLKRHLDRLIKSNNISIRDVGKILSGLMLANATVREKKNWKSGWLEVLIELTVCRVVRPDLYEQFRDCKISSDQLLTYYGGSRDNLNEYNGDVRNPSYDHEMCFMFWTWRLLCADPAVDELGADMKNWVFNQFDNRGGSGEVSHIPQTIERDWIDVLSFYGQT
jgi:hypothetical protein